MNWRHPIVLVSALAIVCLLETLLSTRWIPQCEAEAVSRATIPYLLCGLAMALIPFIKPSSGSLRLSMPRQALWPLWASMGAVGGYLVWQLVLKGNWLFPAFPIDFRKADMLPVIQTQAQRFLEDKPIYDIIPEIWAGLQPIYLPGFWGAFVPTQALGVDIRWTTVFLLGGSVVLILASLIWGKRIASLWLLIPLLPLYYLMEAVWTEQTFLLRFTEEGVSVFYYLLLGFAMWKRISWLEGVAIALCLLSRYSFLPWLPIYGLYVWHFRSRKEALWIAGLAGTLFLLLFVVPYGWERREMFLHHPGEYKNFALRLWTNNVAFFQTTLGLAKYFSAETIGLQHNLHISLTFLGPLSMLLLSWKKLRQARPHLLAFWGLCSLKLTLVIFYNLIVVPVYYLFYVNTFFSVLLLACYIRYHLNRSATDS